eukprot:TRINITY_DN10773_c0_g2_i1.p1 TRINITY_DN10773_c0_g2~~TRINITY_DN10773_c0_g2_i1.p1  ORF type:complete len:405 (+),score=77.51 TRINITY_DN10773_c0_g2_i1:67-1215(+)
MWANTWLVLVLCAAVSNGAFLKPVGELRRLAQSPDTTAAQALDNGNIVVAGTSVHKASPLLQKTCWATILKNTTAVIAELGIKKSLEYGSDYEVELAAVNGNHFVFGCECTSLATNRSTISVTLELFLYTEEGDLKRRGINITTLYPWVDNEPIDIFEVVTVPDGFAVITNENETHYSFTRFNSEGDRIMKRRLDLPKPKDFPLSSVQTVVLGNDNILILSGRAESDGFSILSMMVTLDTNGTVVAALNVSCYRPEDGFPFVRSASGGFFLTYNNIVLRYNYKMELLLNVTTDVILCAVADGKNPEDEFVVMGYNVTDPVLFSQARNYGMNGTRSAAVSFSTSASYFDWPLRPSGTNTLWNVYGIDDGLYLTIAVQRYELLE